MPKKIQSLQDVKNVEKEKRGGLILKLLLASGAFVAIAQIAKKIVKISKGEVKLSPSK